MRDDLGVSVSCSTVHRSLMLLNQTRKKITKQVSCSHLGVCLIGACNAQLRIERFAHGLCRPCTQCIRKVTAIHTAHLLLIMGLITGSSAQDWVWMDETQMDLFDAQGIWGRRALSSVALQCVCTRHTGC